ncbi:MAG: hypothetical protein COA58_09585 [Bacteroidetes bacterium]|nr:MAG: hypothetical protein COA58_09585 [Bacteroidota bacterium]
MKQLKRLVLFLLVITILGYVLSPLYKSNDNSEYRLESSVIIHAPIQTVFDYLGNSENAKDWSSFVDHISPLNSNVYKDGTTKSIRRCYRNTNELGMVWDEEVLSTKANELRTLSIYNMNKFPMQTSDLQTDQIYESIDSNTTLLIFRLYKLIDFTSYSDLLKMKASGYIISPIFKQNLSNIKREVEKL